MVWFSQVTDWTAKCKKLSSVFLYSTSDICVKICVTGSGSAYLLDVHACVVKVTSADGVVSVRHVLTAALTLPSIRTRTQTERRLRVSDALRSKPCGRRLRGPRWGRRRGHWSRQRHFSSPTHVRAFFFIFIFHFFAASATAVHNITLFVCCSGKTIPNGTDKLHLGTPENEGMFQAPTWHQLFLFHLWMLIKIGIGLQRLQLPL